MTPRKEKSPEMTPLSDAPTGTLPDSRRGGKGALLKAGETLAGRYLIIDQIGSGALGTVYRAKDLQLDREIALKVLTGHPLLEGDRETLVEDLAREARAVARLDHPNIVPVHDAVEMDGIPFLTMGLVRGRSLREVLQDEGPMPVKGAVGIFRQICTALDYAHRHGVIHCDIKPSNILLEDGDRVRLADFGIARLRKSPEPAQRGSVLGTAGYTAPEVVRGEEPGPRSDLFSAGAVLYKMLTGQNAFAGRDISEIVDKVLGEEPPAPRTFRRGVPKGIGKVVSKALAKFPEQRYPDGRSMARALQQCLWRRKMLWLLGAAALVVVLVASAVGTWWITRPLEIEGSLWAELAHAGEAQTAVPVRDGTVLRAGDRLWLSNLRPNRDAYLYVFILDPRSNLDQLFPDERIAVKLPLESSGTYEIPPEEQRWTLDATRGFETLFVAASRRAVDPNELEGLLQLAGNEVFRLAMAGDESRRGVEVQKSSPSMRRNQEREVERLLRERFPVLIRYSIVHE